MGNWGRTSYFCEVIWSLAFNDGTLGEATAAYGRIVFDSNRNYTLGKAESCDKNIFPTGIASRPPNGNAYLDISGADGYNSEVLTGAAGWPPNTEAPGTPGRLLGETPQPSMSTFPGVAVNRWRRSPIP